MIKIKQNTKYLNKQFAEFEKEQLPRFKKYYKEGTTDSRKELKRLCMGKKIYQKGKKTNYGKE